MCDIIITANEMDEIRHKYQYIDNTTYKIRANEKYKLYYDKYAFSTGSINDECVDDFLINMIAYKDSYDLIRNILIEDHYYDYDLLDDRYYRNFAAYVMNSYIDNELDNIPREFYSIYDHIKNPKVSVDSIMFGFAASFCDMKQNEGDYDEYDHDRVTFFLPSRLSNYDKKDKILTIDGIGELEKSNFVKSKIKNMNIIRIECYSEWKCRLSYGKFVTKK